MSSPDAYGEYYSPQIWAAKQKSQDQPSWWDDHPPAPRYEPALALDREEIRVHQINWIDFDTSEKRVGYNA